MNVPLNHKFLEEAILDAIREAFLRRFSAHANPTIFTLALLHGNLKITTSLPSGNLTGVEFSIRGRDDAYQMLERMENLYPRFSAYLHGTYKPSEEYHRDIDWAAPVEEAALSRED